MDCQRLCVHMGKTSETHCIPVMAIAWGYGRTPSFLSVSCWWDTSALWHSSNAWSFTLLVKLLPNFEIPIFSRVQRPLLWLSHNPGICSQFLCVCISEMTSTLAWNWPSGWVVGFDGDFPAFSSVRMLLMVWFWFWNQVPLVRTETIVVATTEESGLTVDSRCLRIHRELTEQNKWGTSFWRGGIFFVSNNRCRDIQCSPSSYYYVES